MTWAALLTLALTLTVGGIAQAGPADSQTLARGHYLTRLGDCKACHTQPGQPPFSGGRAIKTPYGPIYTPNITPDKATGIGTWSAQDFYRAMHNGIKPNGDYLYPAFPFSAYTKLRRKDVMAIRAYLRTVKPVHRENRGNDLHWPYSMRMLMGAWRTLYFDAGAYIRDPAHSIQWNRGAYLVKGLTHCGGCHTPRNLLGAKKPSKALSGGTIPVDGWHVPDITTLGDSDSKPWTAATLEQFLVSGRSPRGDAAGPMREVVQSSLRYLNDRDADAIAAYVVSLQQGTNREQANPHPVPTQAGITATTGKTLYPQGRSLYQKYCSDCHGKKGVAQHPYYPDLRNSRLVTATNPDNLALMILRGGFQATTKNHPFPYSMPPFAVLLSDRQIAGIVNYVRSNWGNHVVKPVQPDRVGGLR